MSLVIDLPQAVESQIEHEAHQAGVSPAQWVTDTVTRKFAASGEQKEQADKDNASIALLQSWLSEARKPRTSEDLAEAESDLTALMRNLNAPRREAGERIPFPDVEE